MSRLQDLTSAPARDLLGNMNLSKAVLAIATSGKAKVKTTNALVYTVGGVQYTASALSEQVLTNVYTRDGKVSGGAYVQPVNTTVFYTLSINAAGTVAVTQGTYAGQVLTDPSQNGVSTGGDGMVPNAPVGYTPFGVIKVVTAMAATFTVGTTALDATNVTSTFYDVAVLPGTL